jgi:hypothetical protein
MLYDATHFTRRPVIRDYTIRLTGVHPTFAVDVHLRRNVAKSQQIWGFAELRTFSR